MSGPDDAAARRGGWFPVLEPHGDPADQARATERLSEVLQEVWRQGEPFRPGGGIDWLVFAHEIQERLR